MASSRIINPGYGGQVEGARRPELIIQAATRKPVYFLLLSLSGLCLFYIVTVMEARGRDTVWVDVANVVGPISLVITAGLALHAFTRRYPVMLWASISFYLANVIVFSGLGPLVYYLGNPVTVSALEHGNFSLTKYELLRANLLNAVGIASVIGGFYFHSRILMRKSRSTGHAPSVVFSVETLAIAFLIIGGALRYLVLLPFQFGMTDFVLPGVFNSLSNLFDLGLALCAYLAARKSPAWVLVLWILLPLHLASVVLQFSKSAVILALMLPALGAFLAHSSRKRLAVWVLVIIAAYASMQPLVEYGRGEIIAKTGNLSQATLTERLRITQRFLQGERKASSIFHSGDEQSPWMRIAYSGPQAYAMRASEQQHEFSSLSHVWYVLVPRILWPGKPLNMNPADDFYEFVTGRDTTFVGITIYADAYWNAGWIGVVAICVIFGLILGLMSRWTVGWLKSSQYAFLPAIFMAIDFGLRNPNGWIMNGLFGPLPIFFAYVMGIHLLIRFIRMVIASGRA